MVDYRLPEHRRETFLKFYEFHSKHKSHPGGVYYVMPWLADRYRWDNEDRLWFAYLNGNTQNPVTSWVIFRRFPTPEDFIVKDGESWFNENWNNLQWDMDRRYQKKEFPSNVAWYYNNTKANGQLAFFDNIAGLSSGSPKENFHNLWKAVMEGFPSFGRLAAFSYIEYLNILGGSIECDNLFFEDISGSASHRNGLCLVLGREDLINDKKLNPNWASVKYTKPDFAMLYEESEKLLVEARERIPDADYFTLESTLCTYKSWHKPNRRYPNVYNDMLHDRIEWAEERWQGQDTDIFWECRADCLPEYLRKESNPKDPGLSKVKQNFYRETGIPVMMSKDFPEFDNLLDRQIWGTV